MGWCGPRATLRDARWPCIAASVVAAVRRSSGWPRGARHDRATSTPLARACRHPLERSPEVPQGGNTPRASWRPIEPTGHGLGFAMVGERPGPVSRIVGQSVKPTLLPLIHAGDDSASDGGLHRVSTTAVVMRSMAALAAVWHVQESGVHGHGRYLPSQRSRPPMNRLWCQPRRSTSARRFRK